MSDIIIKGMEMPKGDDDVRIIICSDGSVHRIIGWAISEKIKSKAIELPHHGRLIDVNELEKAVEKMAICDSLEHTIAHEMTKRLLKKALTVLEASE